MKKVILLSILMIAALACSVKKQAEGPDPDFPFPADSDLAYYQAQCDSGYQKFWGDIKAISSAFLNNSKYADRGARYENIRIVNEGLFKGSVEVDLGDARLELQLIRKNQALGKKGIWQVVAARETPWPK
jgi:hypothetical protein